MVTKKIINVTETILLCVFSVLTKRIRKHEIITLFLLYITVGFSSFHKTLIVLCQMPPEDLCCGNIINLFFCLFCTNLVQIEKNILKICGEKVVYIV